MDYSYRSALVSKDEWLALSTILEAVEDGISSLVVADASLLAQRIKDLIATSSTSLQMRACQLALYPKPKERGIALRKMADAIEQILAQ